MCKKYKKKIVCSLIFDEISIREKVDFVGGKYYGYVNLGVASNNISAIANKALVFMLVCVNEARKVPVAYFLIIMSIVRKNGTSTSLHCCYNLWHFCV